MPETRTISRPSLDERLDQGRTPRDRTPPSSHASWSPAADRPDPVGLLMEQDRAREPDLVPVRHGRMMVSPFTFYARLCGWTLARAHARSGDPVAIAEYLAGDDAFDQSITDFCERYAHQNEQDHAAFGKAVRSGRLEAVESV
jgi:hypothetical protein